MDVGRRRILRSGLKFAVKYRLIKMKLRIKIGNRRMNIALNLKDGCQPTVALLKEEIRSRIDVNDFSLSLNGKDPADGDDETQLSDLGIVSGDLITLLVDREVLERFVDLPPPQPAPVQPAALPVPLALESSDYTQREDNNMEVTPGCSSDTEPTEPTEEEKRKVQEIINAIRNDPEAICDGEVNRYLTEPVLIRDSGNGKIPQKLCSLYDTSSVQGEHDAICVVLHLLMLESGFIVNGDQENMDVGNNSSGVSMPSSWKKPGTYKLQYQHTACPGATFGIVCVPLGPVLMIHGTVKVAENHQENCQVKLRSEDYYKTAPTAAASYKSLPKLSLLYKDSIAHCLLQRTREVLSLPQMFGFTALMTEIKLIILRHLNARSILNMARTCNEMRSLCSERSLWRRLYLRDFGRRSNSELNQDWYKHYKEKYVLRKQMREQMRRYRFVVPPDFMRPRPFPFNPDPFGVGPLGIGPFGPSYPPGFIGGDYDRNPDFSGLLDPLGRGRYQPQPGIFPRPRPRFDPIGPGPEFFRPGRGGGLFGSGRGHGPRFF